MRAAAFVVAILALAILAPAASAEEEPGGDFVATPLDVEILYPADGAAFRDGNLTAVIEGDGESVAFFNDDFTTGTLVNATRDPSGVVASASAPTNESYYRSPEMELPRVDPAIAWSGSLEFLTSGSGGNLSQFFQIQVRFGDLTSGRNWSAWFDAEVDGTYWASLGNGTLAFLHQGSLQYQFLFLDPQNASNPHLSQMQVWFLGHINKLEARLSSDASWRTVAAEDGRYNVSFAVPEGPSTIEARVSDALGGTRAVHVNITRDNSAPTIASAPQEGAVIPPDTSVEIKFDGPIDRSTTAGAISVNAPFRVDQVWSADNTTLLLSAQESGKRGLVTVTIGPGLKDKAGNEFARNVSYTYEMGVVPAPENNSTALIVGLLSLVGIAAVGVLYMSGRAKKQREAHAASVRAEMEAADEAPKPPR